ncbi:hypothetical protein AB1N83_011599 [Pleurotus pulmonarius]
MGYVQYQMLSCRIQLRRGHKVLGRSLSVLGRLPRPVYCPEQGNSSPKVSWLLAALLHVQEALPQAQAYYQRRIYGAPIQNKLATESDCHYRALACFYRGYIKFGISTVRDQQGLTRPTSRI